MSNVTPLFTNTSVVNDIVADFKEKDDSAYFPVGVEPLCIPTSNEGFKAVPSYKAVVRLDTNEVLSVVGNGYKLTSNEEIFTAFETAISKSSLKTDGMTKQVSMKGNGSRTAIRYRFPEHEIELLSGDKQIMEIVALNSYDGSWAFQSMVGAYRMICCNGMVMGTDYATSYGRHTKNLDINMAADKLRIAAESYEYNVEKWREYPRISVSEEQAKVVISTISDSEKVQDSILSQYYTEAATLGFNKWALFNALTYWSTHTHSKRSINSHSTVATIVANEAKVRAATSNAFWDSLKVA